jgi:EpsI family protein
MLRRPVVGISLGVLLALAAYILFFPPRRIAGTRLGTCPMTLAGMPGKELGLEQTVLDDLNPDDYLLRRYDRPDGLPVWLVVVYFQNARLGAHDPLLCYRSQGFKLQALPAGTCATASGPVSYNAFRAAKGGRSELVWYFWYTSGGKALAELKSWRDTMFFHGLRKNRSFGVFIRLSTLESGDPKVDVGALEGVLRDLAPLLPTFFPEDEP